MADNEKKIIIFDDDEDILAICSYILEEDGWQVTAFPDCNNLIDHISTIKPDVILMDNWIPDEGGIVATQLIKATKSLQHIPVVYFSANSDIETLAATAKADMYLPKPFDLDKLKEILTKALTIS
ncbi:response regulator [Mucilaginibacter sp. E4BP6]|uniref:response regulator n=1 Tax=Mucilaginibacter sp. E4BP6 TaxID=2723089 RepID=UPI0015CBA637|nr:response regulator [Mucilaginibacter sp. E4BP6]NYE67844.1 two-component system cell cycle response regulator DivK [Mucilaginibacter sp. E4BP6]